MRLIRIRVEWTIKEESTHPPYREGPKGRCPLDSHFGRETVVCSGRFRPYGTRLTWVPWMGRGTVCARGAFVPAGHCLGWAICEIRRGQDPERDLVRLATLVPAGHCLAVELGGGAWKNNYFE
ncbi:hypothetical protein [Paenibacillus agricola]|uniref:Uncharacterized protein n=1 Tax=Paenibacillus agricola TaxID=2716264 RepID=A0ABX0J577_9BACL|nr:hypothetical protein [Paenibacillus agricola]NHN31262.1 hypothetical protein [Paenibacillus agricola]